MKIFKKLLIPLVIILLLCIGFWNLKVRDQKTSIQNEKTVVAYTASLSIADGKTVKNIDISGFIGKTALEATQANAKVITNGVGTNAFITSIDNRAADTKKHEFWELDANGAETQVGAGSYIIQNNDKIEWKISTY